MSLAPAGYVGIGITAPDVALDVDGDIQYTGFIADVSDSRLKTNIESLSPERGDAIAALKPVSFEMKDREGLRELGFIAQDVEQVFPELVQTSESGTKSMNYIGLIAPMVKAIQQLQADNEALKAKVEAVTCDKQGTEATGQPTAPHGLND
ncbi:tail fiber domain-containing protein [Aeoliella sp. SH292]|uniref:tail fiber domain-containing protein n=1 Tax=Aeoliella sp. SH292 TaxID=3454464 RepID=UPI003F97D56D